MPSFLPVPQVKLHESGPLDLTLWDPKSLSIWHQSSVAWRSEHAQWKSSWDLTNTGSVVLMSERSASPLSSRLLSELSMSPRVPLWSISWVPLEIRLRGPGKSRTSYPGKFPFHHLMTCDSALFVSHSRHPKLPLSEANCPQVFTSI